MKEISTEKKKSHPLKLIEKFETEPMEFKPIYEQDKKSLNHKIYIEVTFQKSVFY